MNKADQKERKKVIVLLTMIVVLLAIILFSSIFYIRSSRPMRQAKKEAIAYAEKYADIETVDKFYWFTRDKTYFTILGQDKNGQDLVVIIPKSGEKVMVYPQSEGITEDKARSLVAQNHSGESFQKASLGLYDDTPVWEIVTKTDQGLNYYLLQFKGGEEVKAITNV